MGYITSNQGRPIQGVSQQPEKIRLPGQCSVSNNMRPDVVHGLVTRAGTESVAEISASLSSSTFWHHYDRGTGEEYFISVEPVTGEVKVWSPDGTAHTVNVSDNTEAGYLACINPKQTIKAMTIGDYTFFINTECPIEESSTKTPDKVYKAIIYVQFIDFFQRINIELNGTRVATYVSADGGSASQKQWVRTEFVVDSLYDCLLGNCHNVDNQLQLNKLIDGDRAASWAGEGQFVGTVDPEWEGIDQSVDYNITIDGSTIVLERKDGADFTITIDDDADNKNTVAIKDKIDNVSMLPGSAPDGFLVEIDPPGASKSDNSNFFLKADTTSADHITWRESIEPEISVGLDASTMPHVLVRESITAGVATFSLREGEWADREVGSDETNPQPSFIDTDNPVPIQSVGIMQNRLFFTSGENVIMTRSGDFFNFYRETAQAALDTDPIDVFADVPEVNFLEAYASFDGDFIFFSNKGQFMLKGDKPLTRDNATLRQVTSFECNLTVPPVTSGDNIFFCFDYGNYVGVREFFTDSISDTKSARPITDHVKKYIAGNPVGIATSTNLNLLVLQSSEDDNVLYFYDWLWRGNEKVQSAWGKVLVAEGDAILYFTFIGTTLYLIIARDGTDVYIESLDIEDVPDTGLEYSARLDRKIITTMVKDEVTDTWSVTDPYPNVDADELMVIRSTGAYEEEIGTPVDFERDDNNLVTTEELGTGDVTIIIGRKIYWEYAPSNPVPLDENKEALNLDTLIVGAYYMNYNTTGDLTATIEYDSGNERTQQYSNRTLGGPENLVGYAPLVDGQHRIPIRKKSDQYTLKFSGSSHLPTEVRDFEFNGNMNRRGRRI